MEAEEAITNARWRILERLSDGNAAATELARTTSSSLANITQQAKLLEAWGFIVAEAQPRTTPGKPKRVFRLAHDFAFVALAAKGRSGKRALALNAADSAALSVLLWERVEDHSYLHKLIFMHDELLRECRAIAIVDSAADETHLLLIAAAELVEKVRKQHSKSVITVGERRKTFIAWTHTEAELRDGLARSEVYFTNLLKHPYVLYDPDGLLQGITRRNG